MQVQVLYNAKIVNENKSFRGGVIVVDGFISQVFEGEQLPNNIPNDAVCRNLEGKLLLPGVIDDQVHFREPGLTHKGDIASESRAAVAGGVTSFMEMPNTKPQTTTIELLDEKFQIGANQSRVNYSFYMGATNDNVAELLKVNPKKVCGVKVFMGSSTGNMLVDKKEVLEQIFSKSPILVAVHCEDEPTVKANLEAHIKQYGNDIPVACHPAIRSSEACYLSSSFAVELAKKHGTRLHILHLSTAKELSLFTTEPLKNKRITAEVCVHHLWFDSRDYATKGTFIRWNPAIKEETDKNALLAALKSGLIDVVATDHAPHTLEDKTAVYTQAASGGPLVQHSLVAMLELAAQGKFTVEQVVEKMCHAPAELFSVDRRGYIRPGYWADLVVVDQNKSQTVSKDTVLYKCGWSPFDGYTFASSVVQTYVNGTLVYNNGVIDDSYRGMSLDFNR